MYLYVLILRPLLSTISTQSFLQASGLGKGLLHALLYYLFDCRTAHMDGLRNRNCNDMNLIFLIDFESISSLQLVKERVNIYRKYQSR